MVTATVMRADAPELHRIGERGSHGIGGGGSWTQTVAVRFARVQAAADPVVAAARGETTRIASAA